MFLRHPSSNYINGRFEPIPGSAIQSRNPAQPDQVIWSGAPDASSVERVINAARAAFDQWSATTFEQRAALLRKWAEITAANSASFCANSGKQTGKSLSVFSVTCGLTRVCAESDRGSNPLGGVDSPRPPPNRSCPARPGFMSRCSAATADTAALANPADTSR